MQSYRLENIWAIILIILPIISLLMILSSKFLIKKGCKITGVSEFHNTTSFSILGYYFSIFLIISGMFIIVLSLTKPQAGLKKEKIISEGIDIMIALDTSGSMTTKDFLQQSRIDGAKNILINFVKKRKGDRIGLVTFAESSILKSPATVHINKLCTFIKNVNIDANKKSITRTAIGIGLASAVNRLLKIVDNDKEESKIVILVTDGINNSGEISPETATEIARKTGIRVYTIGIGSNADVDLDLLRFIAYKTGGISYHAKTSGELGPIFEEINKIEKHKIETYTYKDFNDIGYKFSIYGILFMFIGIILNTLLFKRL